MKWMLSAMIFAAAPFAASFLPEEQPPSKPEPAPAKAMANHPRGRKPSDPATVQRRQHHSDQILQHFRNRMRKVTAATWDARTTGQDDQVSNQASCGDCYIHSGCGVVEDGQFTAGNAKVGANFAISRQWVLDCHPEVGGCGGGDEWQVAGLFLTAPGGPSISQYPGAGADPARCGTWTGTGYVIATQTYVSSSIAANGVANTDDIKSWIAANGPVSVAVAAGSSWDNYQAGQVITDPPNPNGINHAVMIIGWKTAADGKTTIWLVKNSWGSDYGDKGTLWIQENSDSIGTEAFGVGVLSVNPPAPPTPPTPIPPTPIPPTPPVPGSAPTMTLNNTGTSYDGVAKELSPAGQNALIGQLAGLNGYAIPPATPPVPPSPCEQATKLLQAQIDALKATPAPPLADTRVSAVESRLSAIEVTLNKLLEKLK